MFYPIAPAFAKYPAEKFEFVLGKAEALDPTAKTVAVRTNDGLERQVAYHTLVIATGTSAREDMPWKTLSTTEETKQALRGWRQKVESAKSIVVAGAGITGTEVAAELAEAYGKTKQKKITLVGAASLPFDDRVNENVRQAAKKTLENMGTRFVFNAKVTRVDGSDSNSKIITLSLPGGKEETMEADVLIPTYGVVPNTSFVPESMLDHRGFVKQTKSLRAEGHDDIFVVGDAGNLETPQATHTEAQLVHASRSLQAYLRGETVVSQYVYSTEVVFGASLGSGGGTGQMKGWKIPSFLIKFLKAKTLATDKGPGFVAGTRTITQRKWA